MTASIDTVFRINYPSMVRRLAARTHSMEDAKDLLQEAFVRVLSLPDISCPEGYLWRIATNLFVDGQRARRHHSNFLKGAQPDCHPSAERAADAQRRLDIVERAISELPRRCGEAFRLHVLESRTFEQVGERMGISARMAKKHVARALEYLQHCVEQVG